MMLLAACWLGLVSRALGQRRPAQVPAAYYRNLERPEVRLAFVPHPLPPCSLFLGRRLAWQARPSELQHFQLSGTLG